MGKYIGVFINTGITYFHTSEISFFDLEPEVLSYIVINCEKYPYSCCHLIKINDCKQCIFSRKIKMKKWIKEK